MKGGSRVDGGYVESVLGVTFTLTAFCMNLCDDGHVHGEVENGGAVAAVHIFANQFVFVGSGWLQDVEAVLLVRFTQTDFIADSVTFFRENCEVQDESAVAAMHGWQGVIIGAGFGKNIPVEVVAAIVADGLVKGGRVLLRLR